MKVLFCHDPLADKQADARFIHEAQAAASIGLDHHLLDYEALEKGNVARAVRHVPSHKEETLAIYRGWVTSSRNYDLLYEALLSRGLRLINTPDDYYHTLNLPESLNILGERTPRTVWFRTDGNISYPTVMSLLLPFNGRPIIMRDFIRSQKHYWKEACYIGASSDRALVEATVKRFIGLQGHVNGGLVFREFVDLMPLDDSASSDVPHSLEYRLMVLDGEVIATLRYWDEGYTGAPPPLTEFADIASQIKSRFFTMDIAQRTDGSWIIIDIGDAQVASLLAHEDARALYKAIVSHLSL